MKAKPRVTLVTPVCETHGFFPFCHGGTPSYHPTLDHEYISRNHRITHHSVQLASVVTRIYKCTLSMHAWSTSNHCSFMSSWTLCASVVFASEHLNHFRFSVYLVGGFSPPLWKIWVRQLGCSKPPTNFSYRSPKKTVSDKRLSSICENLSPFSRAVQGWLISPSDVCL